jgi:pyrimidine operon attenuation protein/uracil phosphoribosyltransferase
METVQKRTAVLDAAAIGQKLRRMALQIAEQNSGEETIYIAGVAGNGEVLARMLMRCLEPLGLFKLHYLTVSLNKKDPSETGLQPSFDGEGKVVIVVDDVADTGRTLLYALQPFLAHRPKRIQTLVLVERSHKLFPVQTDYAGLSLATTLQEHITVETEGEQVVSAWLH